MDRRNFLQLSGLSFFLTHPFVARAVPGMSGEDVISAVEKQIDTTRSYGLSNTIVQYKNNVEIDRIKVSVLTKRDEKTGKWRDIVQYVSPPRDQGKTILNDGEALWFYDPLSHASIRISPQQRLMGQASNADVLTINYSRDYHIKLIGEASITDAQKIKKECYYVNLTPKTPSALYGRLEYWIEKSTSYIIKGKCYAESGALLKGVFYREQKPVLGGVRPMQAILIDALDTHLVTLMNFSDFREISIPEAWFQRAYLPRIEGATS